MFSWLMEILMNYIPLSLPILGTVDVTKYPVSIFTHFSPSNQVDEFVRQDNAF